MARAVRVQSVHDGFYEDVLQFHSNQVSRGNFTKSVVFSKITGNFDDLTNSPWLCHNSLLLSAYPSPYVQTQSLWILHPQTNIPSMCLCVSERRRTFSRCLDNLNVSMNILLPSSSLITWPIVLSPGFPILYKSTWTGAQFPYPIYNYAPCRYRYFVDPICTLPIKYMEL